MQDQGYAFEEYNVTTDDGYILALYRIPGRADEQRTQAPAVLLQHGMESDASAWLINYPHLAPAFTLVDEGYDVWMGNNRGCRFSLGHVSLNTSSWEYWDHDFEEMGLYDVPAEIDFILNKTGQEKVPVIGHSEGATQMLIGLSMRPDYYSSRVSLFIGMTPAGKLQYTTDPSILLFSHRKDQILSRIEDS